MKYEEAYNELQEIVNEIENGSISVDELSGSGPEGRVLIADVEAAIARGGTIDFDLAPEGASTAF